MKSKSSILHFIGLALLTHVLIEGTYGVFMTAARVVKYGVLPILNMHLAIAAISVSFTIAIAILERHLKKRLVLKVAIGLILCSVAIFFLAVIFDRPEQMLVPIESSHGAPTPSQGK